MDIYAAKVNHRIQIWNETWNSLPFFSPDKVLSCVGSNGSFGQLLAAFWRHQLVPMWPWWTFMPQKLSHIQPINCILGWQLKWSSEDPHAHTHIYHKMTTYFSALGRIKTLFAKKTSIWNISMKFPHPTTKNVEGTLVISLMNMNFITWNSNYCILLSIPKLIVILWLNCTANLQQKYTKYHMNTNGYWNTDQKSRLQLKHKKMKNTSQVTFRLRLSYPKKIPK